MKTLTVSVLTAFLTILLCTTTTLSQVPGMWRPHFSYSNAFGLAEGNGVIYCGTEHAIFSYDLNSNTIETHTKISDLTEVELSAIAFSDVLGALIVGYRNGNIDIVTDTETIAISDLKNNKIIPNKTIRNIYLHGTLAYLATDFGIAIIDLERKEFKDTYILGTNGEFSVVNHIAIDASNNKIWAGTQNGLMVAPLNNVNLADFSNWTLYTDNHNQQLATIIDKIVPFGSSIYVKNRERDTLPAKLHIIANNEISLFKKQPNSLKNIAISNGLMHIVGRTSLYIYDQNSYLKRSVDSSHNVSMDFYDALTDSNGNLWVAELGQGLLDMQNGSAILPNGPNDNTLSDIQFINQNDFRATFGMEGNWGIGSYSTYTNGIWLSQIAWDMYSPQAIVQDPKNEDAFYIGGLSGGIHYYSDFYNLEKVFTPRNSQLEYAYDEVADIRDLAIDYNGNLWVANRAVTRPIKIMDTEGNWFSFTYPNQPKITHPTRIYVDRQNNKWIVDKGLYAGYVYNDGAAVADVSDDRFVPIMLYDGEGASFAESINAIAEDKDGAMWIGTENGIATYSGSAFSTSQVRFRRIKVEIDSIIDYVLDGIEIMSIAIDAGNRKWFGTANNGVFLLSENGTEVLKHYSAENSPLPSNTVPVIGIAPQSGEVFFGTESGLVSFLSDADGSASKMENIRVIPNPVREYHRGDIYIRGLVEDATVKITDIAGNLVYETYSYGGTAVWPGTNLLGNRPQTGVYLIFVSNSDGSETRVGKLMFIN